MVQNKLAAELSQIEFEYSKMKGMPIMKKKRHFQAYKVIHEQLQRVWPRYVVLDYWRTRISMGTGVVD